MDHFVISALVATVFLFANLKKMEYYVMGRVIKFLFRLCSSPV
jgi:hypothetical protein